MIIASINVMFYEIETCVSYCVTSNTSLSNRNFSLRFCLCQRMISLNPGAKQRCKKYIDNSKSYDWTHYLTLSLVRYSLI